MGDAFWIDQLEQSGEKFGFDGARVFEPTRWLQGGDDVTFGNVTLAVRHCSGHTPGLHLRRRAGK